MDVRLRITGGYAGPAGWQDLRADLATVGEERCRDIESVLDNARSLPESMSPVFPDGLTYEFDYGTSHPRYLKVTDADISPELREIVRLIQNLAAGTSDGKKEG